MQRRNISLPKLDRLHPTMESTCLKLMEEAGELAQVIGKFRGMSGEPNTLEHKEVVERIVGELVDVAQTAVTMMYVIEEQYDVDMDKALEDHVDKMIAKGYMNE